MKPTAYLTTSWDDGHPLAERLAEMLADNGLPGTFYVPVKWQLPTLDDSRLRALSEAGFELGGHTINHVVLTETGDAIAEKEIHESRQWLNDVTGQQTTMFSPPCGKFKPKHLRMIRDAGYAGFRTVEGWSFGAPRQRADTGLYEMPTTIQAQPQPCCGHLRNIVKRRSVGNLTRFARFRRDGDWLTQAHALLDHVLANGGVFHLWGHSWEIEEAGQWDKLEALMKRCAEYHQELAFVTNGQLVETIQSATTPSTQSSHATPATAS